MKKIKKPEARNLEKLREKISESQEILRLIIGDMEKEFSIKIRTWSARDVKRLYKNYSLYCLIDDLLQVINKALHRF